MVLTLHGKQVLLKAQLVLALSAATVTHWFINYY